MNSAKRRQFPVARIRQPARPSQDAKNSTTCPASLIALAAALILAGNSYPISPAHADPGVFAQVQNAAEVAQKNVGLPEGDRTAQRAADREAKNHGLRYTVEAHSILIKRGAPPALESRTPEIEIDGSLWMTAKLHNDGVKPVRVYWGDYAYPKMYRFDVTHESRWKPPVTRDWPEEHLLRAAREKYFVVIQPKQFASYDLLLTPLPGSNCEHCFLNRPGQYIITPSLCVATCEILNEQTGETRDVPDAWTGQLAARPFAIRVKGDPKSLGEGVTIGGKVVDAAGKAVPEALVTVRHRIASDEEAGGFVDVELAQDVTDADGLFEFFRLPAKSASFELDVQHAELAPGHEVILNNAPAGAKQRKYEAKVTLDAGRTVRGRVMDSQGLPLTDVALRVYSLHSSRETHTDDQGRFRLTGLPPQIPGSIGFWRRGLRVRDLKLPSAEDANQEWTITLRRNSE